MTAMQHVCTWEACDDERFQVCGDVDCTIWRWDPVVACKAADEAHRKTLDGPRTLSQPISATFGAKATNHARPTEGTTA